VLDDKSDSAGRLLPGTSHAIGKHLRDRGAGAGVAPEFMSNQNSALVDITVGWSNDAPCPEIGEWEVRSDARVDARFHFRAGIPSLVPWLVVSGATASGSV